MFVAFQKTGSSSIEYALEPYRNLPLEALMRCRYKIGKYRDEREAFKHISPDKIADLAWPIDTTDYYRFAFVRNPWDRLVSLYHYHRGNPDNPHHPKAAKLNFDEWVRSGGTGSFKKQMSQFFYDDAGNLLVDYIGRYESINEDFSNICEKIGINVELPVRNRSKRKADYRTYYNEETVDLVRQLCAKDIEMFGYNFDGSG